MTTKTAVSFCFIFILSFTLPATTFAGDCPAADLNADCRVDLDDVNIFADQWLDAGECEGNSPCANFDGLNGVNFVDFSFLAGFWRDFGYTLVINEFMASNDSDSDINDPQGDFDDWIEIYNYGDTPIDLAGMYLTDNLGNLTKWQIPSGYPSQTTVPADGFVVFWADEETADGPLHADFKLSAGGEDIGISDASGALIDSISFSDQTTNISYGRYPDATSDLRFFATPTPAADNNGAYLGEIENVEFSRERGFYSSSFNLTLACTTSGTNIYYTIDGRDPIVGEAPAPTSTLYTTQIPITTTKCIRAAAIKTGWKPSPIETHSYIFGATTTIKSTPVISLVGDPNQTFFEPNGIMAIVGGAYDGSGNWYSTGPDSYNNPIMRGREYERPVSMEILDSDTNNNTQIDCGIRVRGNVRPRYKRGDDWLSGDGDRRFSFNMFFRNDYGNNNFDYPLFPFTNIENYKSFAIRGGFNDQANRFLGDEWVRRVHISMGAADVAGTFVHFYLNGVFKCYMNPCGRQDEKFYQEWYGSENDWDIISQGSVRSGDANSFNDLCTYANTHNLADTGNYQYVASQLDIPAFVDYLMLEVFVGNWDWPYFYEEHNWAAARERSAQGKWRFAVWDAEVSAFDWFMGSDWSKDNFDSDYPSFGSGTLRGLNYLTGFIPEVYRALKANPDFRLLWADRMHKHFRNNGALSKTNLTARFDECVEDMGGRTIGIPSYWGWFNDTIKTSFIPNRETKFFAKCGSQGLYDANVGYPIFKANGVDKHGGYISSTDSITITQSVSSGTLYYTTNGSDPRTPFTGAISSSAIQYTGAFTLNKSTNLKTRIYNSGTGKWSVLNDAVYEVGSVKDSLRITEIMYHPLDTNNPDDPNTEYVELKNKGSSTINLNLVRFTKGVDFTFGPNTLTAGQHILVVKNKAAFESKYGTGRYIAGEYSGSLDNSGEKIRLKDANGTNILDFDYKDGWRSIVDGDGYSLTIINPADSNVSHWGNKDYWRASAYINGSPGWDDSGIVPNPGAIAINEVMAHSHAGNPDWIELRNTTASSINIGGWYLSDNDGNLMKYRFATGTTIPANGYIVVREDVNFGNAASDPGRLIPFALSENGDMVCLTSALDANSFLTGYREKEDFGASETGVTFGRYFKASTNSYNFVPMATVTQGAANGYPVVGPVVITEIMYHPDWPATGNYANDEYEYIELQNISGSPVTLYDSVEGVPWSFTDGIDFTFASPPSAVTIPSGGRILVVRNPVAFNIRYPGLTSITYGPYSGWLANEGEQLELGKPGDVDEFGVRQYIRVDRVNYSDGSHPGDDPADLWPVQADGQGKSLSRISLTLYGNDPNNWQAATITPGAANP